MVFILAFILSINVHDTNGAAVAAAHVQLSTQPIERALTDVRGHAQLPVAQAGTFTLSVSANGYKTALENLQLSGSSSVSVILSSSAGALRVIGSVTGHARSPFNATPVATRVFPREAYRDQGQPASSTVIAQTPGALSLTSMSTNPAAVLPATFASVRNGLPFETPVSIDGEPLLTPAGAFDLSLMPTFMLQEVEIVKGPGDVAGDGGGTGGAINFRTAEPTLGQRGTYELEGDSHGGSFTDLAYDGTEPGGAFSYAGMLAADDSGGCCAPDPSDAARKDVLIKLRDEPAQGLTVTVTGMSVALNRSLFAVYGTPGYGYEHLGFGDASASLDRGDDAFAAHLFTTETDQDPQLGSESAWGGSLDWTHASHIVSFDTELRFEHGTLEGTSISETRDSARENITIRPAARSELDLSASGNGDNTAYGSFSAPAARAGYAYTLAPGLALRASYGTSGVLPPLDMLGTTPFTHSTVDTVERSTGDDAGIEWRMHGNTTTLSASVYRNATQGVYALQNAVWQNGPPMVESGEELTLQQFKPVGMGFIAAMQFPRTYVWGGQPLPLATDANLGYGEIAPYRIPYSQGYAELSYKWPHGSRLSIGMLYVGSNNAYGAPAFETLNSNLELSLGPRAKLQFSVQNLTDTLADRVPVFSPQPLYGLQPFTLRFMFRQSFGTGSLFEH
jgi:outer membrane receptor protein involved in Fe transport